MDRAIGEMRKTERRKVLASVSAFTIGNSVYQAQRQCQLPPKHSLGRHSLGVLIAALNWGEPWHSELTQILPCGSWKENKAESDSKQVFMGEIGWKSRVFSQQFGQGHWDHHGSNPSRVRNMSLVKRDFLSSCPCKEREGLWTSAHQGTCLMKVTLPVLWTWNNCKLSIYKWSLLNPILHECWNACTTYKAESCWLRNTGL